MKFIPISDLERILKTEGNVRTAAGRTELLLKLASGTVENTGLYSGTELIQILSKMDESGIVFCDWIEQERNLKELLTGVKISSPFQDVHRWKQHTLFKEFGKFLAPFLVPLAQEYRDEKDQKKLYALFSYLTILPGDERLTTEQTLFITFRDEINSIIAASANVDNETDLLTVVERVVNTDCLGIVNSLSRSSYHSRVWYVDSILGLLKHPACSARLAYRVTQRLKTLDLNPEHLETITSIEKDLKTGQLLAPRKKISILSRFRPASIFTVLLLAMIALSIYFVATYNDQPVVTDDLQTASSFESFSKEERKQIDSLLRAQRTEQETNEPDQDQYLWTQGTGVSLALRKKLQNEKMEELYQDWLLNARLHERGMLDTCRSGTERYSKNYPDVLNAEERKADHTLYLRNESAYEVYVFIFEEKSGGKIYEHLIPVGKTANLQLNKNDHLVFAAGKSLTAFKSPAKLPADEIPSKGFTHHFCQTDMNLSVSLSTVYSFIFPSGDRNKLLISGDDQNTFMVADLYGILDTI